MDITDLTAQLDQLDGNIDHLEANLKPLLSNLNETASRLPLLDRAKLYVTVAYAVESTLHSALRLQGVDVKTHPVAKELARLKQYFEKIKMAEGLGAEQAPRTQALDKQAAIRFIKAGLADNADISTKLKEKLALERAKAAEKAAQKGKKRPAEDSKPAAAEASDAAGSGGGSSAEEGQIEEPAQKKPKKSKRGKGKAEKSEKSKKNKTRK